MVMTQNHTEPRIARGLSEFDGRYDVVFCDVWGVVHNGQARYPAACEALQRFRAQGGTVILITNAPRPNPPILEQLAGLQVARDVFDDMVTSGDVTLAFIAQRKDQPIYHIGPERDFTLFQISEQQTGIKPRLVPLEDASYVVVTGLYDDRAETVEDYAERLAIMRDKKLDMISANPDLVVHVGDQLIYCAGALAQAYEERGGKVFQAGKPFAPIYERALAFAEKIRGQKVPRDRILAIGDAMRTDVAGAVDFGIDALFVTKGIHREELHANGELDLAAYRQFLSENPRHPLAAIPELVW
jgi:HAD superfamily hydrolase (TIGR01459 family)